MTVKLPQMLSLLHAAFIFIFIPPYLCFANANPFAKADIIIAGGSLSATAAAITLGNLTRNFNRSLQIVLLEPTDWAGGQVRELHNMVAFCIMCDF